MKKNNISSHQLLSREQFKILVFKRDKHTCVFCSQPSTDAHHIYDRALWTDGGYYLNNGASVCAEHHWAVEKTDISISEVLKACKIDNPILPPQLDSTKSYDKWGNIVLEDGTREPGVLFWQDNVQKILLKKLFLFGF